MQRVKQKADQSKEQRENIELPEEKVSIRGEPIPFKANIITQIYNRIHINYFLSSGLHSHGRGHPVQEGPEGWRRKARLQGSEAQQPHHAQLPTHNWYKNLIISQNDNQCHEKHLQKIS